MFIAIADENGLAVACYEQIALFVHGDIIFGEDEDGNSTIICSLANACERCGDVVNGVSTIGTSGKDG
jgi:hypothetical protein